MMMLMAIADVDGNADVDNFNYVMLLMIGVADDDDAGPAVGGDDGGSVILWEIPSLHKIPIMKSSIMKTMVTTDSDEW